MWLIQNIPKIVHFYWGLNKPLSFIRYISIKSFILNNPDWHVFIHIPKYPSKIIPTWDTIEQKGDFSRCTDYLEKLKDLNASFIEHDFEQYGFYNDVNEIHKSDFIRWYLLSTQGGVWSDTDILYVKPIDRLKENVKENSCKLTFLCKYPTGEIAIGFLMSSPENHFFRQLHSISLDNFNCKSYQSIGSILVSKFLNRSTFNKEKLCMLDYRCTYSLITKGIFKIFEKGIIVREEEKNVIGYHWYGGHPQANFYEINMTEKNFQNFNNTFSYFIKGYL